VSVDLIYGLPKQTAESFTHTLDSVVRARPDRIAAYSYAHLPEMFRAQRLIREEDLPSGAEKLALLTRTVEYLTTRGYEYIGMDHFALPEDDLVKARYDGSLHRNFQGYSTHAELDLVGLGVSAIGKVGNSYAQSIKLRHDYYDAIDAGHLPTLRGVELNADDVLRREVIHALMCGGDRRHAQDRGAPRHRLPELFRARARGHGGAGAGRPGRAGRRPDPRDAAGTIPAAVDRDAVRRLSSAAHGRAALLEGDLGPVNGPGRTAGGRRGRPRRCRAARPCRR
jgi:hypothetical protein